MRFYALTASGLDCMAKNTGNTEFRKVDVDQYTESTFRDEQAEETTPIRLNEAEVKSLIEKGKSAEGLLLVLQNAPINSKDQALKDLAFRLIMRLLAQIKSANIDEFVASLDGEKVDLLMKYVYCGFENAQDGDSAMLLTWHEKVHARGKAGSIIRVMTDRRRV
ncbi:Actin protein 2/3 complex subunit 5 [Fasciola hepatica]|uniref:Actin-related protein 2/3 complex subunit 5 n=1 Tax=Fasciola hepatica TaxID=6192 RepID=A0A4E0RKA7_FASHE|nr:Actin protein 2/3 complex subunit 5 [Fasciola hepatica]